MFGFGPIGSPDLMLLYLDVREVDGALRIDVMQRASLRAWPWHVLLNGSIVATVILQPQVEARVVIPLPDSDVYRVCMLPKGRNIERANAWFRNSSRAIITWVAQDCDYFKIYSDAGLGGAVDTLLA